MQWSASKRQATSSSASTLSVCSTPAWLKPRNCRTPVFHLPIDADDILVLYSVLHLIATAVYCGRHILGKKPNTWSGHSNDKVDRFVLTCRSVSKLLEMDVYLGPNIGKSLLGADLKHNEFDEDWMALDKLEQQARPGTGDIHVIVDDFSYEQQELFLALMSRVLPQFSLSLSRVLAKIGTGRNYEECLFFKATRDLSFVLSNAADTLHYDSPPPNSSQDESTADELVSPPPPPYACSPHPITTSGVEAFSKTMRKEKNVLSGMSPMEKAHFVNLSFGLIAMSKCFRQSLNRLRSKLANSLAKTITSKIETHKKVIYGLKAQLLSHVAVGGNIQSHAPVDPATPSEVAAWDMIEHYATVIRPNSLQFNWVVTWTTRDMTYVEIFAHIDALETILRRISRCYFAEMGNASMNSAEEILWVAKVRAFAICL